MGLLLCWGNYQYKINYFSEPNCNGRGQSVNNAKKTGDIQHLAAKAIASSA